MTALSQPKPLQIWYVRHGETEWSLSGQHTGNTDLSLTANGELEARDLVSVLNSVSFDHVFCSPMQRAGKTCALAGLAQRAIVEPALSEWNYGDYEGVTSKDIRLTRPSWNIYRDGCPNGETPQQISARADGLIQRLQGLGGTIALFSHGQFGSVLAARWIELAVMEAEHLVLNTASISIFGYKPSDRPVPILSVWNASPRLFGKTKS